MDDVRLYPAYILFKLGSSLMCHIFINIISIIFLQKILQISTYFHKYNNNKKVY